MAFKFDIFSDSYDYLEDHEEDVTASDYFDCKGCGHPADSCMCPDCVCQSCKLFRSNGGNQRGADVSTKGQSLYRLYRVKRIINMDELYKSMCPELPETTTCSSDHLKDSESSIKNHSMSPRTNAAH
uniref:ARF7EP_C domain-containing protein n=1 Tax=Rhabditophanes sp. KR3021 TaxID=114890 RepID=A0AC35TFY2_9BILA